MIASFITNWFKSLAGAFTEAYPNAVSGVITSPLETVDGAMEESAFFFKPAADGMAGTATAATKGNGVNGIDGGYHNGHSYDMEVFGFIISPNATLTADAANTATINILTDDAADGAPASALALRTTIAAPGSGNWAVDVHQKVTQVTTQATVAKGTMTAANLRLRPGANLFVSITKEGTGVIVPICQIQVLLRRR